MTVVSSVCRGCGAKVDPVRALPFRCPEARDGDGIDHVLLPSASNVPAAAFPIDRNSANPFVRYRALFLSHRAALTSGLTDAGYVEIVESLDAAVTGVDGRGFRVTPLTAYPEGHPGSGALWIKNDTGNVAGSHKARHVFGVMVYLRVIEALRLSIAEGLRGRPLAIASCGNAALAAAVVARASDWPIDVFIPDDAEAMVVAQLRELGARLHVQTRAEGVVGDPCVHAFRAAVEAGGHSLRRSGQRKRSRHRRRTNPGLRIGGSLRRPIHRARRLVHSGRRRRARQRDLSRPVPGARSGSGRGPAGDSRRPDAGRLSAPTRLRAVRRRPRPGFRCRRDGRSRASHRGRYMWPWEDTPPQRRPRHSGR